MNRVQRARGINQIMTGVFYLIAVFFFTLLIGFASYVIIKGFTGATPEMFAFARKGSIGNQLFNTIYLVFISLLFSIPLGVTAGIYLAMYAKKGFLTKFLRICIETLSSLPSIVVGLFGYLVFLVFFGLGKSLLAGALSVSILAIPVITTTTEDAINGLPGHYLQASLGLTYLFIAHDLSMVRHISQKVGVMYLGSLVEFAETEELYEQTLHPYTKALMSAVPELDPAISKTKKPVMLQGDVPSPIDTPVGCKFASRCPYATKRCHEERPIFRNVGNEHYVACHLVE